MDTAAYPSETHGNFTFTKTAIPGVIVVDVRAFEDERGSFQETYKACDFKAAGIDCSFVQDNQSSSIKGVLRGLHFQIEHPQAKLVRVIEGEVFDVACDLRPRSSTFGQWVGVRLSGKTHRQLFIPRDMAHGFLVLSSRATFAYKCDDIYHPGDEGGIAWNDPDLAIAWPELEGPHAIVPLLSKKDRHHLSFAAWKSARGIS